MGHDIPFDLALPVQATGPKIHDLKLDLAAAITCPCPAGPTLVTRLSDPGICPLCRRRFPVDRVAVKPTGPGTFEISVNIAMQTPAVASEH